MKRSRFTEEQIIGVPREQKAGGKTADVCRRHGVSEATFYRWKAKRPEALEADFCASIMRVAKASRPLIWRLFFGYGGSQPS